MSDKRKTDPILHAIKYTERGDDEPAIPVLAVGCLTAFIVLVTLCFAIIEFARLHS